MSYKKIEKMLEITIKANRTPMIWGPPGIGKSAISRKVAEKLGMELYVIDAMLFEPTDFLIPKIDEKEGIVKFYTQEILMRRNVLILIDDLPHAKPYQQTPLFQLILDKRIGNIRLDNSVRFIVTGNREEDSPEVNPVPTPLLNRLVHIELEPNLNEWLEWASEEGVDHRIISFLLAYPNEFVKPPVEGVREWPTPRSWHILSDIIKGVEDNSELLYLLTKSAIGEKTGSLFYQFIQLQASINPEQLIRSQKFTTDDKRKLYAEVLSVSQYIVQKDTRYIVDNQENMRKMYNTLPGEFKLLFGRAVGLLAKQKPSLVLELIKVIPELREKIKEVLS